MRSLDLSLHRIARLHLFKQGQNFKAVHVAGTNGKGSICTYLSRFLGLKDVRWGRYTSPYLTHPRDAVVINREPMSLASWNQHYARILKTFEQNTLRKLATKAGMQQELAALEEAPEPDQRRLGLLLDGLKRFGATDQHEQLSEFELETAIALHEFNVSKRVDVAIIEAGMGGTDDATNIVPEKLVTVLSHIGLEHTEHLGTTETAIALNKAGIMAYDAPCVIDGHSPPAAIDALAGHARRVGAPYYITTHMKALPPGICRNLLSIESLCFSLGLRGYEKDNMWCAYLAGRLVLDRLGIQDINDPWTNEQTSRLIMQILESGKPAGRMHFVPLPPEYNRTRPILVDGAHNALGAEALGESISQSRTQKPITWILAFSDSKGKEPADVLARLLIQPQDYVAAIQFKSPAFKSRNPANMTWEGFLESCDPQTRTADSAPEPVDPRRIMDALGRLGFAQSQDNTWTGSPQVSSGLLQWAVKMSQENPIVVTGSLYMIRDLFRFLSKDDSWEVDAKVLVS